MQALLFASLAVVLGAAHLPARLIGKGLRGGVLVLLFVTLANGLWFLVTRRFEWAAGSTSIRHPIELGMLLLRLANLLVLGGLLAGSTSTADAAAAVESMLRPLGRVHAPLRELGLVVGLAIGFVPLLRDEALRLATLQRLKRGRRRWSGWARLRAAVPLVVPLFVGVLRRADEVALALDARAFEPGARRTSFVGARCGRAEWLALAGAAVLLGLGLRY
jgi:energy-coupling factor transport system permease protein